MGRKEDHYYYCEAKMGMFKAKGDFNDFNVLNTLYTALYFLYFYIVNYGNLGIYLYFLFNCIFYFNSKTSFTFLRFLYV